MLSFVKRIFGTTEPDALPHVEPEPKCPPHFTPHSTLHCRHTVRVDKPVYAILPVRNSELLLSVASGDHRDVAVINTRTGKIEHALDNGKYCFAESLDLISQSGTLVVGHSRGCDLWCLESRTPLDTIACEDVKAIAVSPTGSHLAMGDDCGAMHLYDLTTKRRVQTVRVGAGYAQQVRFSPDGALVACATLRGDLCVCSMPRGRVLWNERPKVSANCRIAFSPTSQWLLSAHGRGFVLIWDSRSGQLLREVLREPRTVMESVAISEDGELVVAGSSGITNARDVDDSVWVWNASTWKSEMRCRQGVNTRHQDHTGYGVRKLTFLDTRFLVSAGDGGVVRFWDLATMRPGTELRHADYGANDDVLDFAVCNDGKAFATAGRDEIVRIWSADGIGGQESPDFRLPVEDVFVVKGRGTVVTGRVQSGRCRNGQAVLIRKGDVVVCKGSIAGIEAFNRTLETAGEGENVGLILTDIPHHIVERGMVVSPA